VQTPKRAVRFITTWLCGEYARRSHLCCLGARVNPISRAAAFLTANKSTAEKIYSISSPIPTSSSAASAEPIEFGHKVLPRRKSARLDHQY